LAGERIFYNVESCGASYKEFQMKHIIAFAAAAIASIFLFSAAQAAEQTFAKPKEGSLRVDWCLIWGAQCGKPAADRFCQNKGFQQSNDFVQDVDIGAAGLATLVQQTGQVCNAPNCDGFTYITCQKNDVSPPPPPPGPPPSGSGDSKLYKKPKVGGARLAYCLKNGFGCDGQTAADAYCEAKGWDDAADFNQSAPLTKLIPTRYIGNGKICQNSICFSFSDITCENN
jgi:hypothetical protein